MVSTTSTRRSDEEVATRGVNVAVLRGVLSSEPASRTLASGDQVHSYEVTVREDGVAAASVPVVVVGGTPPKGLAKGDEVVVVGRVRRRFFRAGGATASRTEVVAERIVAVRRAAGVSRALASASSRLDALAVDGGGSIA